MTLTRHGTGVTLGDDVAFRIALLVEWVAVFLRQHTVVGVHNAVGITPEQFSVS